MALPKDIMEKENYKFKFCIIGQETARQKLLSVRLMRSEMPTIAIDSFNAEKKDIIKEAQFAVVFRPTQGNDPMKEIGDLVDNGWPEFRILIENDDFPLNEIPADNIE